LESLLLLSEPGTESAASLDDGDASVFEAVSVCVSVWVSVWVSGVSEDVVSVLSVDASAFTSAETIGRSDPPALMRTGLMLTVRMEAAPMMASSLFQLFLFICSLCVMKTGMHFWRDGQEDPMQVPLPGCIDSNAQQK
jgi:hypothetical protein